MLEPFEEVPCCSLLLRHGPPPSGVKWYGTEASEERKRMHIMTKEARDYVDNIIVDCRMALEESGLMSHFSERYRAMYARKMKNDFLRWCHERRW